METLKGLLNTNVKRITVIWIMLFILALLVNFRLVASVLAIYFCIWLRLTKAYRGVI